MAMHYMVTDAGAKHDWLLIRPLALCILCLSVALHLIQHLNCAYLFYTAKAVSICEQVLK